ncbi:MAG: hydrolase, partial [Actinobacteria bacterium]|nr:hydrolase [Actinomycetota bacterium]NIS36315.1 hydrolase [Actinomycetota bacterium]NIT98657.1 hydrolase [Actinomycetota bacterium]NIU22273.1 hydrolase [Actinomycetota bacterium]NIU70860.1 hydrolase [Actinomycetota bacterium]
MSHTLRNARLSDGRTVDIGVAGGLIEAVSDHDPSRTGGDDLAGWLVLPAMAEPH